MTALLTASAGCGGGDAGGELAEGARVRFLAPGYSRGWQMGMVGTAGDCTAVMVPDSWNRPRRFDVVPVDSIHRLQVSARGGAHAAAATIAARDWKDVNIRSVHSRYGGCSPMGLMP